MQLFTTGYGLIAQSVVGWTDEVRTPYEIQRSVEVRGGDPSDHIYRVEPMGQLRRL